MVRRYRRCSLGKSTISRFGETALLLKLARATHPNRIGSHTTNSGALLDLRSDNVIHTLRLVVRFAVMEELLNG